MKARKQYFDENLSDDIREVLDASARLGISEFRLFHIAYKTWYGHEASEATIERHFIPYMFHDVVPPWVRHLSARIERLDGEGRLTPASFGITPRRATAGDVHRGRMYALCLVTAMVTLLLLAELAADQYCLFPPCY